MIEKTITSYDMTLAKTLMAYRQGAQRGKVAVVVDESVYAEDDAWIDVVGYSDAVVRNIGVYNPELGADIVWLTDDDHSSQIGDVVAYEIRNGDYVITKNFTRDSKEQIVKNFKRAYSVVFGDNAQKEKSK